MKRFLYIFLTESHAFTALFALALGVFLPSYKTFVIYLVGMCIYILIKNSKPVRLHSDLDMIGQIHKASDFKAQWNPWTRKRIEIKS